MKTVLLLSILLWAASAAPAEDTQKALETAVDTPQGQMAAAPAKKKSDEAIDVSEMEDKMMKEEEVIMPDSVPVPRNTPVSEEAAAPESRYNFCPSGWFSYGSRCFMFSTSAMNWYSAEEHCNSLGAHLASATSPQEYSFLQQMTQTAGQSIAWLGGFNLQGRWLWIDRQGFYYTNFHSSSSVSSYPCLYLRSNNGWGNTQCGSSQRFICSKNAFSC